MKFSRRHAPCLFVALAGACLGACASRPTDHIVYVGSLQPSQPAVASLGAGDSLGRAIYSNDVVLARSQTRNGAAVANADDDN